MQEIILFSTVLSSNLSVTLPCSFRLLEQYNTGWVAYKQKFIACRTGG